MEPIYWLILFIILLVIEIITLGLTTIWFAGGALAAFIASMAGAGFGIQFLLFLIISLLLLFITRPIAMKYFNKDRIKTNVQSLIGTQGIVLEDINNLEETGKVKVNGMEWTARSSSDYKRIAKDTIVEIVEIKGVKAIVKEREELD